MRILITGAGGFVGRALVTALRDSHDIVAVDSRLGNIQGIEGDITDPFVIATAIAGGCDAIVHLATVPGGAAESDPALAKAVNVDATMALIDAAAASGNQPKFVFASSIAVFGDPLPTVVDDDTPVAPRMFYGAHKAMMEAWIATQTRRAAIKGLSLRLPGIVARPRATSAMKSAFMSDVFHALRDGEELVVPVSPDATMWLMSVDCIACNIVHALGLDADGEAITLPALRVSFGDLVAAIASRTGQDPELIRYQPDAALEAAFGRQPPLFTTKADCLGYTHDGTLQALVATALSTIEKGL